MAAANTVFILMWIAIVLPLILFNLKKIYIKKEGEKPRLNILTVTLIPILSVIITLILIKTYTVTINYQPVLVADRLINTLKTSDFDEAEKKFSKLIIDENIKPDIKELFDAIPDKGGRYQLGTTMTAKYFYDKEFFPSQNVDQYQEDVVCVMVRIDNNNSQYDYYTIRMRKINKTTWRIEDVMKANEEAVDYAINKKLIPSVHSGRWIRF